MKKVILIDIISALLILLFFYAGFSKVFDLWGFKNDLSQQPFPDWFKRVLVWVIPSSEIIIAVLLVIKHFRNTGLYLSLVLMFLFTGYTAAILLHFFPYVPCGCGGVIRLLSWSEHLGFNLFFVFITIAGIVLQRSINGPRYNRGA